VKIALLALALGSLEGISPVAWSDTPEEFSTADQSLLRDGTTQDEAVHGSSGQNGLISQRSPIGASESSVSTATSQQLQEIVVTAEKRESTVQNTPISLTAVSGSDIQERGLVDLEELALSIPGVSMRTSGPGQTEFEMRGIASTGGNSPTVGFYLDDIPLTAPAFASNGKVVIDPNLYDLSRVEVLRGPQGTLYGSGSMGGTIKVVTNAPDPTAFSTSAEAIFGDTDGGGFNHSVNAMLNLPFGANTAALRIVGTDSHTSGWIDRIVIANGEFPLETNGGATRGNVLAAPVAADYKDVNSSDLDALRGSILWTPTDRLAVDASYFYQSITQPGAGYIDSDPGRDAHYQPFNSPEPFSDYFNLAGLNFRYRFEAFDLTSVTSRWTRSVTYAQDGSEEFQLGLGLPSYYISEGGIGPPTPTPSELDSSKQFSEELRIASSRTSDFEWLVGYFYSDFTSDQQAYFFAPGAVRLFGISNLFDVIYPTTIIQNSLFGELSYRITPTLKASVGARRYSYSEDADSTEGGAVGPTGSNTNVTYHTSATNQGVNPKFSLSYQPGADLLLYSTVSKGFRPGGGTGPVPTAGTSVGLTCEQNLQSIFETTNPVATPLAYAPDSVWSYEIGEKLRAFENRLVVNSAVYFADWRGIQQTIPLPCGYNFIDNVGVAHVYGSEVEIQAVLPMGFGVTVNTGYTHADLVSATVFGVAGISVGTPVQQVPEWTSSQSLTYRHGVFDRLILTARVENDYVGARTDATYLVNQLPAYDLTSLRVGLEDERWSTALFVTNAFNKRALLNNITQIGINVPTFNRVAVSQPLTIGVDINYRFGR
jgi:iron complex outermembrane recepter protein